MGAKPIFCSPDNQRGFFYNVKENRDKEIKIEKSKEVNFERRLNIFEKLIIINF